MNILVTGAKGFIGRNLVCRLRSIAEGKDRTRPALTVGEIYEYGTDAGPDLLDSFCARAEFVFHLAGVNRPEDPEAFMTGNAASTAALLSALKRQGNRRPVMLASSVQAAHPERYGQPAYGRSKRAAEELLFAYGRETGAPVLVYRLPNVFGKWCRPNYNSAVATFCHNIARGLPIRVDDPAVQLELVYIDDLVEELLNALEGRAYDGGAPQSGERFCAVPVTHRASLGEIAGLLETFRAQPGTGTMPPLPPGSLAQKLYAAYLSYLPQESVRYPLDVHMDGRGSFTELLRMAGGGQFSVCVTRPGAVRGRHWHNSKWELFFVVSGRGLIRERRIGTEEVWEFQVSGERPEAVHMLPGCTHELINLSHTEDLITLLWASEPFDPRRPDTFFEPVTEGRDDLF